MLPSALQQCLPWGLGRSIDTKCISFSKHRATSEIRRAAAFMACFRLGRQP